MKFRLSGLLILLLSAACLAGGCIHPGLPPAVDATLAGLDTAPLKGKIIVIDPGHGGPERGAIAQNGLCEAEVNLGVSLYLWGYLKAAGAQPLLTRTVDTALFKGEPFALRSELVARSAFSNDRKADLFISVHHNSDGKERGDRNDLMIFYKMADPGCSLDVARDVCTALNLQMQADPASTRPGNYLVLRNTLAPAILGEASYMNYKKNSDKLAFHRILAAEAKGYFLGVLAYYGKGVPAIAYTTKSPEPFQTAQPTIAARITAGAAGAALAPGSIKARLNGGIVRDIAVDPAAGTVSFTPETPLANAGHELCLDTRNSAGNAAPTACTAFTVAVPPASITLKPLFSMIPADGQSGAPIDISVVDSLGRPVLDGTKLELTSSAGRFTSSQAMTKNGRARVFLISDTSPRKAAITVKAGDIAAHCKLSFGTPQEALFMAEIKDAEGRPVAGAALIRDKREVFVSDADGRVFDCGPAGAMHYKISRKGYEPLRVTAVLQAGGFLKKSFLLRQVDKGVFFNRTVMLDAAGQSQAALPLLRELKRKIEQAGGSAFLTWDKPPAPSLQDRVMQAAKAKAHLFLSIAHAGSPSAEYYYKSVPGQKLAEYVCRGLNTRKVFGRKTCSSTPGTDYVIMQTSMPALLLRLPAAGKNSASDAAASLYGAIKEMFAEVMPGS